MPCDWLCTVRSISNDLSRGAGKGVSDNRKETRSGVFPLFICLNSSSQVIFEGVTGTSYTGDIAIDDVEIMDGACPLPGVFVNQLHWPCNWLRPYRFIRVWQ